MVRFHRGSPLNSLVYQALAAAQKVTAHRNRIAATDGRARLSVTNGRRLKRPPDSNSRQSARSTVPEDRYDLRVLTPFSPRERCGPRFIVGKVRRGSARK